MAHAATCYLLYHASSGGLAHSMLTCQGNAGLLLLCKALSIAISAETVVVVTVPGHNPTRQE